MIRNYTHRDLPPDRQVYVVRFWQAAGVCGWLGQLHDVASGETLSFATPDALLAYLQDCLPRSRPSVDEDSMQPQLK